MILLYCNESKYPVRLNAMSKKKLTEKELLEGMTPYNTHSDLLAKSEIKPDWISFADGGEWVTDDFMAN